MRTFRWACVMAVAAGLLLALAPAGLAKKTPPPKRGSWSGPTAQGFRADFRVSGKPRKVARFVIDFHLTCSDGSTIDRSVTSLTKAKIKHRKFGLDLDLSANDLINSGTAKFRGKFRTSKKAKGTASDHLNLKDGRTCDSGTVTWRAKHK